MIRLFVFPPALAGTPNPGPFCIKLEMALRLSGLAYETEYETQPQRAPKQKVPYVEIDGERIGDSTLILQRLKETHGIDLDAALTPRERAQSHALQRMLEERLYFVLVYGRWMEDENWKVVKDLFFSGLPFPLKYFVPNIARKSVLQSMVSQGIGRHTRDEIYQMGMEDLDAVSAILGDKSFLFGDQPSMADATAYGFLISIIGPDIATPLKAHAIGLPNLVTYCERMGEVFARAGRARVLEKNAA
jgi:glutathione S-transferase